MSWILGQNTHVHIVWQRFYFISYLLGGGKLLYAWTFCTYANKSVYNKENLNIPSALGLPPNSTIAVKSLSAILVNSPLGFPVFHFTCQLSGLCHTCQLSLGFPPGSVIPVNSRLGFPQFCVLFVNSPLGFPQDLSYLSTLTLVYPGDLPYLSTPLDFTGSTSIWRVICGIPDSFQQFPDIEV